jgi:hypothetical protein
MDGVDENYDDPSSPRQPQQQQQQQQQNSQEGMDGIAGLDMNLGAIVPPSAEPPMVRVRNGRVASFYHVRRDSPRSQGSRSRSQSPDFGFNLDSFLNDNPEVNTDADDFARLLSREQLRGAVAQAAPPNVNRVVSSILEQTPQQRRQQRLQQQRERLQQQLFRYREMIIAIMRECPNMRMDRLSRLITAIEYLNESRLLEHLRQLEQMLHMRRRTRARQNVTVSHSEEFMRAFRRLDCISSNARARRAFYALISQLRDQVVQRLDELNQIRIRRAHRQLHQSQSKGGKRQTRKKSTKRNRTVKRR